MGEHRFRIFLNVYNTDSDANGPDFTVPGVGSWQGNARNGGDQFSPTWSSDSWPEQIRVYCSTKNPSIGFSWELQVYSYSGDMWTALAQGSWSDTRGKDGTDDRTARCDHTVIINQRPILNYGIIEGADEIDLNAAGGYCSEYYSVELTDQFGVIYEPSLEWSVENHSADIVDAFVSDYSGSAVALFYFQKDYCAAEKEIVLHVRGYVGQLQNGAVDLYKSIKIKSFLLEKLFYDDIPPFDIRLFENKC